MKRIFYLWSIFVHLSLYSIDADDRIIKNYFLSTPRSGLNLMIASLAFITRKPIFWRGGTPSFVTNKRLEINFETTVPLLYRGHIASKFENLMNDSDRLLLLTRNPKEVLFRRFDLESINSLDAKEVKGYLVQYLSRFRLFEKWNEKNRKYILYEDFVTHLDSSLLNILEFMEEEPKYMSDFLLNKEGNLALIQKSYNKQHKGSGESSKDGPRLICHSKGKDPELLKAIDERLKQMDSYIYDKYLKRFEYSAEMYGD